MFQELEYPRECVFLRCTQCIKIFHCTVPAEIKFSIIYMREKHVIGSVNV